MKMTREEIIHEYEAAVVAHAAAAAAGIKGAENSYALFKAGLNAIRPVSRKQVEKVWKGEWMGSGDGYADGELVYDTWTCSECGHVIDEEDDPDMLPQFCPKCYAAMTAKAVEIVMERMDALYENIYNG